MGDDFEGKVALVTGAARGQGRSHAVGFAEAGADIIAIDLCRQMDTVIYPMSTPEDLKETARLVEKTGRRVIASEVDVRNFDQLAEVVTSGVTDLGRLDFVLANAGILPMMGDVSQTTTAFDDAVSVMLNGVFYTIEAALPTLIEQDQGGAIVITSSSGGLKVGSRLSVMSRGLAGYVAAKHGVVGLMRYYANSLGERSIRCNSVHTTAVNSPMVMNQEFAEYSVANPDFAQTMKNLLPTPMVELSDVTEAMLYLCGHSGRYVTGVTLPVDGGSVIA